MNFLGQVNMFEGRAVGCEVEFADIRVPSIDKRERRGEVRAFVRPHELDVSSRPEGTGSLTAVVLRVHAAGSVVRLDLQVPGGALITAELPQDRFADLNAGNGDRVFVTPRRVHVF